MRNLNPIQDVNSIKDLVKVLNSSVAFYDTAIAEIDRPIVKSILTKMLPPKRYAIEALQSFIISEEGDREEGNSFVVDIREAYSQLLASFKSDPEYVFISQLEEVEDKILDLSAKAIEQNVGGSISGLLSDIHYKMKICHDEMKSAQKATA